MSRKPLIVAVCLILAFAIGLWFHRTGDHALKDQPTHTTPTPSGKTPGAEEQWKAKEVASWHDWEVKIANERSKLQPTYYVSPSGSDEANGRSSNTAFATIQKAVDRAEPGETIWLADGVYLQDIRTKRSGTKDHPITIAGSANAVVKGGGEDRVIEVNHDYVTLQGFVLDGLFGSTEKAKGYRDKLLYVHGREENHGPVGFRLIDATIQNAGGECIRLRYFVRESEIAGNTIGPCGVHDFNFDAGGKNGEGIYIGTAPEQRDDGKNPTEDPDQSNNNHVHHNIFNTRGNECVDVKEGASGNIIEHNHCTGQEDPESGGIDFRGNANVARYNEISGVRGAGVRLGGDKKKDGINNDVYANFIHGTGGAGLKLIRQPQREICGNIFRELGDGELSSEGKKKLEPAAACE